MFIKYCGPAHDYSGYGEAVRHDIGSLYEVGIPLITEIPRFCLEITDFGRLGKIAKDAVENTGDYKGKILHVTPNIFKARREDGKYNIARVFWETSKLPEDFVEGCNSVDEIWTGSEYNKQAIINSGIKTPVKVIPQAIDTMVDRGAIEPFIVGHHMDYKFYSIFEWTARKNPEALLKAFWLEFENELNVSLSIKTYVDNFTKEKRQEILADIQAWKDQLGLKRYAPVYVFNGLLNRHQMYRFHKTFDCFVSTHRGEGWGIPQMEALFMRKPVISTNCGGIHEFLVDKADALLLPFALGQVQNTRNHVWYNPDQQWANVSIDDVRSAMRFVYDHQDEATSMGINGGEVVEELFSLERVGRFMRNRLLELELI